MSHNPPPFQTNPSNDCEPLEVVSSGQAEQLVIAHILFKKGHKLVHNPSFTASAFAATSSPNVHVPALKKFPTPDSLQIANANPIEDIAVFTVPAIPFIVQMFCDIPTRLSNQVSNGYIPAVTSSLNSCMSSTSSSSGKHPIKLFFLLHVNPHIGILNEIDLTFHQDELWNTEIKGAGARPDLSKGYVIVMQHPVTTEHEDAKKQANETIQAIHELKIPTIWIWPNVDAGTDDFSKAIRV